MAASPANRKNRIILFVLTTVVTALALYFVWSHFGGLPKGDHAKLQKIPIFVLAALLGYLFVRALNAAIFDLIFRFRKGYEAPTLARNVFTLLVFAVVFVILFRNVYFEYDLGALFTTSAIFGVIIGLALQDTLGNFFAGISLHADRPFQVGDVIVVGSHVGVVESITWRAIKLRTFTNRIVLVSNSNAARESIEVSPRNNLNARLVLFGTLYSDSPAKTIHVVREAVRDADNVSDKITPIVRIRNFGDSSIDWEIKYWLEDYAKYNDTDALVRQRIWYALRRNGLTFAFPTRTLYLERQSAARPITAEDQIADRLSAVDIFAPLSPDELRQLSKATVVHVFAPGETLIRAGDEGSSMFVVHNGRVAVQISDRGTARTVATLTDGNFFGEMALFTGEPRTANVVAVEETEVFEIGHAAMKHIFQTNPDLAESISWTITERQADLARDSESAQPSITETAGLLSSIKRFFGLR
ncbi:MAG TPA: mechanosensitive ion channel family protein [Pyrinomonadaceae bacterium]|jgi:small-conductance mechanosensitive channel/CRP-like cAMP-binding protein|nr:mechanosensitive ion channel family protein [Pyrinomonadaceae bacterium]